MTDDDRIEALLALADPDRTADMEATRRLMVFGLAETAGRGYRPTLPAGSCSGTGDGSLTRSAGSDRGLTASAIDA